MSIMVISGANLRGFMTLHDDPLLVACYHCTSTELELEEKKWFLTEKM